MSLLGACLAALVGLSLGLLGGGGSILTVPIFVYVLGFGAKPAIAMSLIVVGAVSLFAGVMLVAAFLMFRDRPPAASRTGYVAPVREMPLGLIALAGIAVGLLTGLVGVGGGFLIVPALVILGRVPMKRAVGTSLLVIAMNSVAGSAGYLGHVEVVWSVMALFTAVAMGGVVLGAGLVRFVPQHALRRAFALFLVVMGGFILYQNRGVLALGGGWGPETGVLAEH